MSVNATRPAAIVIGLDCMTGLQTARLLAERGVRVIAIAKDPNHYCCRTNVCDHILFANTASEEFVERLESLNLEGRPILYPCSDMAVLTLSRHRERLRERYLFALPEPDVVEMLMDKIRFVDFAIEKNLPIPGTFLLRERADVEQAAQKLSYPCILKPPMKTPLWESNTKLKVFQVDSAEDLLATYDRCHTWADVLMVQEWVDGTDADLYSCNCYFDRESRSLTSFIARKIRQWPPHTGTSCLGEEVRNDDVRDESLRLFESVGYHGLGYVEMKRDARTGRHYIIEPNIGRPTGRSAISEAGGVELLYTMYCDLAGLPLPENRDQQYVGARWISLRRDAQSAFYYWRKGELTLSQWWQSWQGRKGYAVWSLKDPWPFWVDLWRSAMAAVFKKKKAPAVNAAPKAAETAKDRELVG